MTRTRVWILRDSLTDEFASLSLPVLCVAGRQLLIRGFSILILTGRIARFGDILNIEGSFLVAIGPRLALYAIRQSVSGNSQRGSFLCLSNPLVLRCAVRRTAWSRRTVACGQWN